MPPRLEDRTGLVESWWWEETKSGGQGRENDAKSKTLCPADAPQPIALLQWSELAAIEHVELEATRSARRF